MYNETVQRLEKFTDPGEFERLGCDLLARLGHRGIEPQGVGRKDGGKDALHLTEDHQTIIHFSLREDWDNKLLEDLETTKKSKGKYTKFVFVSNRFIPPIRREQFKELIRSKYGWEPVIMDQEALRVELDNHSLDLRRKYLGIPEDYESYTDEVIDAFLKDRDQTSNYLTKSHFVRLLLLSVPDNLYDNRMKLFDEKMKFVGNRERLESILAKNIPFDDFQSKVTSMSFSTYHIEKDKGLLLVIGHDNNYECNLYQNGIIEVVIDLEFWELTEELIVHFIIRFFETIQSLYPGFVNSDESIRLVACLINARNMKLKKGDGKTYSGEGYYFYHEVSERFATLSKEPFFSGFVEVLKNKIFNFFNV